jgi:DNA-binding GntR family transcriptional regulator
VSRAPIREAFRILEFEGLLKIIPRKGFFVADININDIEALYAIRPFLEGIAAKMACQKMTASDLEKLSKIVIKMKEATGDDNLKLYFKLNNEFHECIYQRINNEILYKILKNMENQAWRYRSFAIAIDDRIKQSLKNHINLYNALRERNEKKVERLRRLHVENGGKALKKVMNKKI